MKLVGIALFASTTCGCGGDEAAVGSSTDAGADGGFGGDWAGNCTRVAALIAQPRACVRDDDCPCGMGCGLGQCVSTCIDNAQCAGGTVCDAFGRCASPERANRPIPPGSSTIEQNQASAATDSGTPSAPQGSEPGGATPIPLDGGTLRFDRAAIELLNADAVATVRVSAVGSEVKGVRVKADAGVLVQCAGAGDFAAECTFLRLAVGAVPAEIKLRAEGAFPNVDERVAVRVNADTNTYQLGVLKKGAPATAAVPREGTYEGTAWLVGAGLKARTTEDMLPTELARLRLSVRARVFPSSNGKYTVAFDEARGTVFPAGAVGTLSVVSGSSKWQLAVPSRQYLGDDVDVVPTGTIDVHATETMTDAIFKDGVLLGDLITQFEGATTLQYAPFVRWRLSLSRSSELGAGDSEPAVTTRAVADVTSRANTAFAEEAGLTGISGFGGLTSVEKSVAAWCTRTPGSAVTTLTASVDARGDLFCAGGASQGAYSTSLGTLLDRGDYLDGCVHAFDPTATTFGAVSPQAPCANRARAISTMALAFTTDRNRALGTETTANLPLSRLGSRAVQLWLGAQSVTGSDPNRIAILGPLLPGGTDVDKLRYYAKYDNAFAALERSIGAWDAILHPRVGAALAAMQPAALAEPDYRVGFPNANFAGASGGEQSVGLPVNILATLTSQLDGVSGLVDALANQRITGQVANRYALSVAKFMPRSVVLFAMAQGLRDAARSNGTEPWENSWLAVRSKYGAALAKLSIDLRSLETQENPLGLEDSDLPLYRLGEQVGAGNRFSAVSDSLLGREDSRDPAIAPVLIDRARDAELLARDSLSQVLQRDYQSELQTAATARNLQAIKRSYGEQITSLCGFDNLDSLTVLDNPAAVDENTCFLVNACLPSAADTMARASNMDNAHQVCLAAKLRKSLGDAITGGTPELNASIDELEPSFVAGAPLPTLSPAFLALLTAAQRVDSGGINLPDNIDPKPVLEARSLCDSAREASLALRPTAAPSACASTDDCPPAMVCDGSTKQCVVPQEVSASCYQGSLGAQLLGLQSAATDLKIAIQEFNDYALAEENALQSCRLLKANAQQVAKMNDKFNKTMADLAAAKAAMDILEKGLSVVREIAGTAKSDVVSAIAVPAQIAMGAVEITAFAASAGLDVKMGDLERSHEALIDSLDRETEVAVCMNEAGAALIGQSAAALRVTRQQQQIAALIYDFLNDRGGVTTTLSEGLASLAFEQTLQVLPSNADYWLDENIDLFQQRLRRARRATYLAILAVEYEFQQSSAERSNVLAAQSSLDLEGVLGRVRDGVRRGAPSGGGNPTELRSVLSLRKNVLQLGDRSTVPEGWHQLTDTQRFQFLLVSPEFASYDAAGGYLGQEIPFSLAPIGSSNIADPAGIPLFSGLSCAERIWSVNAVVQGKNLMVNTETSLTTLQVRKRNTFQSQWCSSTARTATQVSSTRPGVNLFIDPLSASSWGNDATLAALTGTGDATAFSFATVQARLGIDQKTVETDDYTDGASTALAGRGAFGEYTLFIPRTSLSVNGSAGLALENVEDVLIRLDYVAAERQ